MTVKIILEEGVDLPKYATPGSAAVDLRANIEKPITLKPGEVKMIGTGIKLDMTESPDICAEVLPRSGMGKKGLVLANTIGLIDNDYQGEVMILAFNRNPASLQQGMGVVVGESITIDPNMRIAQLKFSKFVQPDLKPVKSFAGSTKRGEGGIGSTGEK